MTDQPAEKPLSGGELIIVAIILAILSAILLPQYSRASINAERTIFPASIGPVKDLSGAVRAIPFVATRHHS